MIKQVDYPRWMVAKGIGKNHRGFGGAWNVAGADTETVDEGGRARPYTLQFSTDGALGTIDYVDEDTVLPTFVERLDKWARWDQVNTVWFHNLSFDLTVLLANHQKLLGMREFTVELPGGVRLLCFTDRTWFARLRFSDHRTVHILDTFAYFKTSLAEMLKDVGAPVRKQPRPEGLGTRRLRGREFERYALMDALGCWHVGKAIEGQHKARDLVTCVSAPQYGARTFRHHYIREGESIAFPPEPVARAATLAYHGGKNAMPPWVKPGWHRDVFELDIISAYSWSMTKMPGLTAGKYRRVREVPTGADGIVCVTGEAKCAYGCVRTHDFKPVAGRFDDTWMTSYEVDSAVAHKCLRVRRAWGYVWESGPGARNPFAEYALHFYREKSLHKRGTVEYEFNKILNNSLTGKLIQTKRNVVSAAFDAEGSVELLDSWTAGGLFNPVLAAWVTGRVRARLHDLEEKYASLHSSTDSLKCFGPVDAADLGGLGGLKVECRGDCLILRPKLYLHLDGAGKIAKWALHGFQGTLAELRRAARSYLRGEDFEYFVTHCWSAREVLRRNGGPRPLQFTRRKLVLRPAGLQ